MANHLSLVDAAEEPALPFTTPFLVLDDFLPQEEALAMRQHIDSHFADPQHHTAERHQVWNYWHVPGLYTYLRTQPEKVIERSLVERLVAGISVWAEYVLGLGHVTWPYLSLYVDGCEQKLHNDATNGRFGFVYSLTRDERKTIGGQTIILKDGDLFRANMGTARAGRGLQDFIEPKFNQLVLFDDRMPHGVQRVEGPMDPVEGRFVLHGHISESGPVADGPLEAAAIARQVQAALGKLIRQLEALPVKYHGPLVLRLAIAAEGTVQLVETLVDRVARSDGRSASQLTEMVAQIAGSLRFPARARGTEATVPLLFGGNLPWMCPTE